jgi:hypothetical protein
LTVNQGGELVASGTDPLPLIFNGATLSGDGGKLKGTVKLSNAAVLAPGYTRKAASTAGKLTIEGNLEMDATTVTEVSLMNPGSADMIDVTGTAQIAGSVKVDIKWRPEQDTTYPLITAKGAMTGSLTCEGCGADDTITIVTSRRLTDGTGTSHSTATMTMKGSGGTGAPREQTFGDANTGETHMYGGTGAQTNSNAEVSTKPESYVEIGTNADVTYASAGNTFGGKGFENLGTATFSNGNTKFEAPVESSGQVNLNAGASFEFAPFGSDDGDGGDGDGGFAKKSSGYHIGGTGMKAQGELDINKDAELFFDGPLTLDGAGYLNVSEGAYLGFSGDTPHMIGGQGMESSGKVDFFPGSELAFAGPCHFDGDAAFMNVTDGAQVAFDPLPPIGGVTQKHTIGGKGMENEGMIYIRPGVTMDATAPVKNSGQMIIGGEGADSTFNCASFSALPGGETSLNSGGMLVATGTDPLLFTGATLSGNGGEVKGTVKLTSDAQLAPGNPKDATTAGKSQLTITGDLEMDATTVTKATVKATSTSTTADKIVVTGTAQIAGTITVDVKVRPEEDIVVEILTATGGITGTYASCNGCGPDDEITYTNTRRRLGDTTSTVSMKLKGSGEVVDGSSAAATTTDADAGLPVAAIAGGAAGVVLIGALVAMFAMKKSPMSYEQEMDTATLEEVDGTRASDLNRQVSIDGAEIVAENPLANFNAGRDEVLTGAV